MRESERLQQARIKAGFSSAAQAAKALGVPYSTYAGHENGSRGLSLDDLVNYAKQFGADRSWLAFGDTVPEEVTKDEEILDLLKDLRSSNRISGLEARVIADGLRRRGQNEALPIVTASAGIPAKHAEFFFERDTGAAPSQFVAVDERIRLDPRTGLRVDYREDLSSSTGAHCSDWMDGSSTPGSSPEAVFAQLWLDHSPDRASIKDGLAEMAKIEECEWARKMLGTLQWIDDHWRQ